MKFLLISALVVQLFAFSGPVCGNHVTTDESMDCCAKGHNDGAAGVHDPHSAACCKTCDMGKTTAIEKREVMSIHVKQMPEAVAIPAMHVSSAPAIFGDSKPEYPPGTQDILILKQQLRI